MQLMRCEGQALARRNSPDYQKVSSMRVRLVAAILTAAALGTLTGCGGDSGAAPRDPAAAVAGPAGHRNGGHPAGRQPAGAPPAGAAGAPDSQVAQAPLEARVPQELPGLGPETIAEVPQDASQVVVVTGQGKDSPMSGVVVYHRTPLGWHADASWKARNALEGWTNDHYADDLRSPIGVFGLTDAGGLMPDPGTKLPYDQSGQFAIDGLGFEGESLADAFDYVVAINYNRVAGVTPLDKDRPLGEARGGGIWFHVDHGGPTHGCVSLSEDHIRELLRMLEPSMHPVVVMGDAMSLSE